ncbi:hypothetical protein [Glycomyces sp. MUSA5-2]|uniref:hypothetical protein n=1 Tax=Glycomyces sp. MUSA5-2 TaxID=2053002 RepID=UPI0030086DF8
MSAATSTRGLPHGTVLGRAQIGDRTVVYAVDSGSSIWCTDAASAPESTGYIGVIRWGESRTPHLHVAHQDALNSDMAGLAAELTVVCGMALWRWAFGGLELSPGLPAQPNSVLGNRRPREVSGAGR